MTKLQIYVGFDKRPAEVQAFAVAMSSIRRNMVSPSFSGSLRGLVLDQLISSGLYTRPTGRRAPGVLWDEISDAPMSTEFSISRFLVPIIADGGWALFVDGDVMARGDILRIMRERDDSKACMVVKHKNYQPVSNEKMDGQIQTAYPRKNWSSVVLWNCDHPATRKLTGHIVNTARGLWLHQFSWLDDNQIGELDPKWNWLVGYSSAAVEPSLVHFTDGTPAMKGYENEPFASEWWHELRAWAGAYSSGAGKAY